MSIEDDPDNFEVELKELVTQTLEENGILSKIKAQLRAGLYLALEDDIKISDKHPGSKNGLMSKLKDPNLALLFNLVREFLEFFGLPFTCEVFDKESFLGIAYEYEDREKLIQSLGLELDVQTPLLLEILNISGKNKSESRVTNTTYDYSDHSNVSDKNIKSDLSRDRATNGNFNETFNRSSSSDDSQEIQNEDILKTETKLAQDYNSPRLKDDGVIEPDDTYEGTSSIAEDPSLLIDFDKSTKSSHNTPSQSENNLIDQTLNECSKLSKSVLSPENSSTDKKFSNKLDRVEKLKPMSSFSLTTELPPLQVKTRNSDTDLLPSPYSKEFREKSGVKELDTILDVNYDSLDNYEEDIMSSGTLDYENNVVNSLKNDSIKSVKSTNDNFIERQDSLRGISEKEDRSIDINSFNKPIEKQVKMDKINDSTMSSISEDFDLNSNIDDLLKSDNSI